MNFLILKLLIKGGGEKSEREKEKEKQGGGEKSSTFLHDNFSKVEIKLIVFYFIKVSK